MKPYRKRRGIVEARQLSAPETVKLHDGTTVDALPGQYVVEQGDKVIVLDDADFEAVYEPVVPKRTPAAPPVAQPSAPPAAAGLIVPGA